MADSTRLSKYVGFNAALPREFCDPIMDTYRKYEESRKLEDLDELLRLWRLVLALADSEAETVSALESILQCILERQTQTEDAADLDELIITLQKLLELQPDSTYHSTLRASVRTAYMGHLAVALLERHKIRANVDDLEASILFFRRACALAPDNSDYVQGLIAAFHARFEDSMQNGDVDEIVKLSSRVLDLDDTDLEDRTKFTSLQQVFSFFRFQHSREAEDLDISLSRTRTRLTADDDSLSVRMMGIALEKRFLRYREASDIDLAISLFDSLLGRNPDDISAMHHLARSYSIRYYVQNRRRDIDEAVALLVRAIQLHTSIEKPPTLSLGTLRMHLAFSYSLRFDRGGSDVADIDSAITVLHDLKGSPDHGTGPAWYLFYAKCLMARCNTLQDAAARHEMISVLTEALDRFHQPEFDEPRRILLRERASALLLALEHDMREQQPFGVVMSLLHDALMAFVDAAKAASDIDSDQELFAAQEFSRVHAAYCHQFHLTLKMATDVLDVNIVKDMYSRLITRMPEAIWLGHTLSRRYEEVSKLQSVVGTAVATAFLLEDMNAVLEWFEQGRAVVWSQIQDLRTPLDDLREKYPDLADALEEVSADLEDAGLRPPLPTLAPSDILAFGHSEQVEERTVSGRRLARERKQLLEYIRSFDGFQSFLQPKPAETLLKAARDGNAVVCINVYTYRCDALIISRSGMHHVRLPQLTPEKIEGWHVRLTSFLRRERARAAVDESRKGHVLHLDQRRDDNQDASIRIILGEMWHCVVLPILEAYLDNFEGDRVHITWCTTGKLAFLPLHAAGPHDGKSPNAFDVVISSYAPNLSSLLPPMTELGSTSPSILAVAHPSTQTVSAPAATMEESAKVAGPYDGGSLNASSHVASSSAPNKTSLMSPPTMVKPPSSPSILVVAQPNTPNASPLPGTVAESKKVAANFPNDSAQVLLGEHGTTQAVLKNMAKHPYIHFACHGKQDTDPTRSAFLLNDDSLTLHTLMAHKSSNAQLAFLSACETATGDEKVPNEAVHLAAGMLAAGYKSVVATMWSIGDTEAPRVADEFYGALLADPEHNVAFALHDAVKKLREHVGVENFVKWMPYIHLGV